MASPNLPHFFFLEKKKGLVSVIIALALLKFLHCVIAWDHLTTNGTCCNSNPRLLE